MKCLTLYLWHISLQKYNFHHILAEISDFLLNYESFFTELCNFTCKVGWGSVTLGPDYMIVCVSLLGESYALCYNHPCSPLIGFFFNLHHLNKNIENLLRHFCIQESRLKTKIGCCWGWGFQSALHRGKHGTASATQSHQQWVQLIAAAIWNLDTSCCIMVIWLSGNSRNSIPW